MAIALLTGFYWRGCGERVNASIGSGDVAATRHILSNPRAVLLSRLENAAVLAIIILMVLRPG